jgi:putative ABC transport system permease protein
MKGGKKPPRILERLLKYILPRYIKEIALGDFEEEYDRIASSRGPGLTNLWYFTQILKSIPAFMGDSIRWGSVMFRNYMKVTLRTIRRHKGFAFINIIGLAVGMACVLIIMLWIQYETSFEKCHEKANRIFRVAKESHADSPVKKVVVTPPPLSPALLQDFPEIEAAVRVCSIEDTLISYGEKHFLESYYAVDSSFFRIFTIHFLEGDVDTSLNDPYSIVLSENTAKKYFGNRDPLGEIMQLGQKIDFRVTGIIKNMPSNSHLLTDIFVPYETWAKFSNVNLDNWWWNGFYTYILLKPNANPLEIEAKFEAFEEKYGIPTEKLFLQPLSSIHLHSHFLGEINSNTHISTLLLFGSIAVLILTIACINYMNLSTARSSTRLKEVGARKVIGAHRSQIARQFLGESLVMSIFSLGLSFFLAYLFLPFFNSLAERKLALNEESLIQIFPGILALILFVGLFAGSYPALLLSSFKPITVLRGGGGRDSQKTRLRNVLVIVQFSVSLILIIATLLVKDQLDYVRDKEMGFDKDRIVVVRMYEDEIRKNVTPVLEELKRNPKILCAAPSQVLPNDVRSSTFANWPGRPEGLRILINAGEVGYDYTELYGIEIIMGRSFSREFPSDENGAFLINEKAMRALGEHFLLGMGFSHWGSPKPKGKIVGVMKDFHLHSLHEEIKPLYFYLNPNQGARVSMKIQGGNIQETIEYIRETMEKFSPNYPFEYHFFDDIFNMAYINEQKMERIFAIFAMIAILIACMGVFGLSAFIADQKRKEIGIRKVLGASVSKIVYLLSRDLVRLVLVANIIGWPVAYYAMGRWLQNFAYRTKIGLGIFLLSALLTMVVSLGTVSYQAIKAALVNPVDALRYE